VVRGSAERVEFKTATTECAEVHGGNYRGNSSVISAPSAPSVVKFLFAARQLGSGSLAVVQDFAIIVV
jgi:hypothetical protein